jgi:hypothetical protein
MSFVISSRLMFLISVVSFDVSWCRRRRRGGPTSGGHGSPLQEGPEICDATDHYVRGKM